MVGLSISGVEMVTSGLGECQYQCQLLSQTSAVHTRPVETVETGSQHPTQCHRHRHLLLLSVHTITRLVQNFH